MSVATMKLDRSTGRWQVWFEGKMITDGAVKHYVKSKVKSGVYASIGITDVRDESETNAVETQNIHTTPIPAPADQFSVQERFDMVFNVVKGVAEKALKSAVILGEGGLGKSDIVLQALKAGGLQNIDDCIPVLADAEDSGEPESEEDEVIEEVIPENCFIQIKGYSTARGLYETLYKYNGRTIVFDDCDKVLVDPAAEMIFKGALDSNDDRWISWGSRVRGTDIPKRFMFTGTIVFVSNRQIDQIDQALRSRALCIDLTMTKAQKIERIASIGRSDRFISQQRTSIEAVDEAIELIESIVDHISDLNMRTLIKAIQLRSTVPNWKDTFEFVATSG